jgi:hypothetical protein
MTKNTTMTVHFAMEGADIPQKLQVQITAQ